MRSDHLSLFLFLTLGAFLIRPAAQGPRIEVVPSETDRRVDIAIDGKPFTAYIYPTTLKKPVLFPLRTARGTLATRGFPLEPRPGERVDHPHHVGLWFTFGDVNGLDFWNNSDAIPPDRAPKMGTIVHTGIVQASGGHERGTLVVDSEWRAPDGRVLLAERTQLGFAGRDDYRSIDRITTLTAQREPVVFRDNKEGALGMRVTRALEQPAERPETFTDTAGKPSTLPVLDNTGVTGVYLSSEGKKGDAVWGTRGRWATLSGTVGEERVTLAILDHPDNPGHPTYWHARGYGLFAANPLGRKVFDDTQPELTIRLEPGQAITFRHRVLILGGERGAEEIEREYRAFTAPSVSAR